MWNKFICWYKGHSYAVFHRLLDPNNDSITCSRCGQELEWSEIQKWFITKRS